MNVLMMTNTFAPHVGGVARSVEAFAGEYRRRGHRVLVVAPEFEGQPDAESGVVRVPAIQRFNGSDFSVAIRAPRFLSTAIDAFRPDVVHSHHPFLLGATALRVALSKEIPIVFTHHTMYEQYTHYTPADSQALKRFVVNLTTSYANLCDCVFAPSESVEAILRKRGIVSRVEVVPTGCRLEAFAPARGPSLRSERGIPGSAFVVGHVGRLAPEKNLDFLGRAVAKFLRAHERAHFLLVGKGPLGEVLEERFRRERIRHRLHAVGELGLPRLASAYRAMDVFAFASKTETQGMVLVEAMAAGVPVVALDAPGARETVRDRRNGRLLRSERVDDFAGALQWLVRRPLDARKALRRNARATARRFSLERTADRALDVYESLRANRFVVRDHAYDRWTSTVRAIRVEWDVWKGVVQAAGAALRGR